MTSEKEIASQLGEAMLIQIKAVKLQKQIEKIIEEGTPEKSLEILRKTLSFYESIVSFYSEDKKESQNVQ
jgi:hypothetical protein